MTDQLKPGTSAPEHAEMARVLADHPLVAAAAVAVGGDDIEPQLLAFVVPSGAELPEPAELRQRLAGKLPAVDGPDAFVLIDRLPETDQGEPDTAALCRAGRGEPDEDDGSAEAPDIVGGLAAEVADIWREVFGLDRVDLADDIFDLGGHSLTITRISVQIRSRLGVDVPLSVFYDTPTVTGIVAAIEETTGA
jgi:acyl carrier protein